MEQSRNRHWVFLRSTINGRTVKRLHNTSPGENFERLQRDIEFHKHFGYEVTIEQLSDIEYLALYAPEKGVLAWFDWKVGYVRKNSELDDALIPFEGCGGYLSSGIDEHWSVDPATAYEYNWIALLTGFSNQHLNLVQFVYIEPSRYTNGYPAFIMVANSSRRKVLSAWRRYLATMEKTLRGFKIEGLVVCHK